jgi:hypothetical protein
MSNLKISQLPLYTGDTTGFYIPVNNSGETITYKTTKETLFGTSGVSGTSGTSGTSGSSGINGSSGSSGVSGTSGSSGSSGVSGTSGSSGQNGTSGSSGSSGQNGTSGSSGSSGVSGTSGSSGVSGTSGSSGVSGTSGSSGQNGTSGTSGANGTSGTSGANGTSGSSGENGSSGSSGVSGTSGSSGTASAVDVYSGGTMVVSQATQINFSGATITSGSTGVANITITPGGSSPYVAATQPRSVISDYSSTQPLFPYSQILGGSGNTISTQTFSMLSMSDFDNTINPVVNYNAGLTPIYMGNKNSNLRGGVNIANYNITNTSTSDSGVYIDNISGTISAAGHSIVLGCVQPNLNAGSVVAIGSYNPVAPNGAIRSVFIGGYTNAKNGGGDVNGFLLSTSCTIQGTTNWNTFYTSNSSTINGGSYNNIIGSNTSNITGGTYQVMLGTSGRTATQSKTTYTENHASFGQSYQGYFDNGSGSTFTIDWNNGNTQKISLTGSGGITCSNTQTGAHYRMVINNPDGYTPSSFTAAGRTIKFNGGSFVVYSGESICELFITNDSVFVNQLGLFS